MPAVRELRPQWIAFREPASSRNLGVPTALKKLPFPDVVYSPHSYDPVRYDFEPQSSTFTLRYRPDATITAPTAISVAARAYPDGLSIACDGCESSQEGAWLSITKPPAGETATITNTPASP